MTDGTETNFMIKCSFPQKKKESVCKNLWHFSYRVRKKNFRSTGLVHRNSIKIFHFKIFHNDLSYWEFFISLYN